MNSVKRIITGVLVGGWVLVTLGGDAMAQVNTREAAPAVSSDWGGWRPRTLRGGRTVYPQPRYRTARRPTPQQIPGRIASRIAEPGLEEIELPSGEVRSDAPPPDIDYESAGMDSLNLLAPGLGCGGCADCGGTGYGDCGGYAGGGYPGGGYYYGCGALRMLLYELRSAWWTRDLSLFAGAHGFKGPFDQGRNGNFGLHEGVNLGAPFGGLRGLGYQVGFAAVHSNFSGDRAHADAVRRGDRDQIFFTTGIFRRAVCGGLQWGVAFDLLHDAYYGNADLKQIRSEAGYVLRDGRREIGYFGAYGIRGDNLVLPDHTTIGLEPTGMFAIYYRRYFENGGDGRFWTGFSGNGDGLLGADLRVPLGRGWAIENRISYLVPKEGRGAQGQAEESWGLNVQLVWYLGQPARCALGSPYRPMFNVADNATFMSDAAVQ